MAQGNRNSQNASSGRGGRRQKLGNDPLDGMQDNAGEAEQEGSTSHSEGNETNDSQGEATMAASSQSNQISIDQAEYESLLRSQKAVRTAATPMMSTDSGGCIYFLNERMEEMLRGYEREIADENRGFRAKGLEGEELADAFPQFRSMEKEMTRIRNDFLREVFDIGRLRFRVTITGNEDEDGSFTGNVIEWADLTEERAREENEQKVRADLEDVIMRVRDGQLSERVDTDAMSEGTVKATSKYVNQVVEAVQNPLQETIRVMKEMSEGNLHAQMNGEFKGDFEKLQEAVNKTQDVLRGIVESVTEATSNISSAAQQISQGNQDLSQRTEEQASSLEESASSLEELTSTVKQNADNAQEANQVATAARDKADRGGELAKQVVEAMGEIKNSSSEVNDIITVIDEIAFQTNLLALNAAVEAARAGEHGRGFGVVAAEVRNLAQRSASSAKDIKKLIKTSSEKVEEGTKLVDESRESLEAIMNSIETVNDKIAEIAAASNQQSTGVDEINKAVTQLDEVTQQNASLVEEAAAAAESMDEQTNSLADQMTFFGDVGGASHQNSGNKQGASGGQGRRENETGQRNSGTRAQQTARPNAGQKGNGSGESRPAGKSGANGGGGSAASGTQTSQQAGASDDSEWEEF